MSRHHSRKRRCIDTTTIRLHKKVQIIHNSKSVQENEKQKKKKPYQVIVNKKWKTCQIEDFAVPVDHRLKIKESEKRDKYLDLAGELKKYGRCR